MAVNKNEYTKIRATKRFFDSTHGMNESEITARIEQILGHQKNRMTNFEIKRVYKKQKLLKRLNNL